MSRSAPRGCVPVLSEIVATCSVCGDVCSDRDLCYVTSPSTAARLSCGVGDTVCLECAAPRRRRPVAQRGEEASR